MAVARIKEYRGQGETRMFGTSGANYVGQRAPATVTTQYTLTYPAAPPVGSQLMEVDAAGVVTFIAGSGGSLDTAYDFGGAGAGRIITADTGPVEIQGVDGLRLNTIVPKIEFQTPVTEFNWRIGASFIADAFLIQRGDQDADVSDDTFDTILSIAAPNRRVGINTAAPDTSLHLDERTLVSDAEIRLQTDVGQDQSITFVEGAVLKFEVGYDESANGFKIGRLGFLNPSLFIEDTTGDIGINEAVPDAKLHVFDTVAGVALLESSNVNSRMSFRATATTDENQVFVGAVSNAMDLGAGGSVRCVIDGTGRFGINRLVPGARLHIVEDGDIKSFFCQRDGTGATVAAEFENAGGGDGLLLDQNGSGTALRIDSESTINPLLALFPLTANVRGDIAFGTSRTAAPASPNEGDLWYDATLERFQLRLGAFNRTFACPYGSNFPSAENAVTIAAGIVNISGGIIAITAEGGGPSDTLDTINSSPQAQFGDTILLRAVSGDSITLGNGTGNMKLNGSSVLLNSINDNCVLFWNATNWVEISRVQSAVA